MRAIFAFLKHKTFIVNQLIIKLTLVTIRKLVGVNGKRTIEIDSYAITVIHHQSNVHARKLCKREIPAIVPGSAS